MLRCTLKVPRVMRKEKTNAARLRGSESLEAKTYARLWMQSALANEEE
jgi:hypothetical protein